MSQGYVQNASSFAKGVDAAEEAIPDIKQEILTGARSSPRKLPLPPLPGQSQRRAPNLPPP